MSDYAGNAANTLPGSNQILPASKSHNSNLGPRANKVQAGQLPKTKSGPVGRPNRANPLGSETSLNG